MTDRADHPADLGPVLSFAPMEGVTGYVLRNAHHAAYGGVDRYYMPFVSAIESRHFMGRELRDIDPANNRAIPVVPQVLTGRPELFLWAATELHQRGYNEVNLNLGCPAATAVTRGRGAGLLADPDALDRFLEEVFDGIGCAGPGLAISVKTRLGMEDPAEFRRLAQIYDRYPLREVIIHARVREAYYEGTPDLAAFGEALTRLHTVPAYNGDIRSPEDYARLREMFPEVRHFMVGRGLLTDPALAEKIKDTAERKTPAPEPQQAVETQSSAPEKGTQAEAPDEYTRLFAYLDDLIQGYSQSLSGEKPVLAKMKELWYWLGDRFPGQERIILDLRHARDLSEYRNGLRKLKASLP